jgi:hypothetical protein
MPSNSSVNILLFLPMLCNFRKRVLQCIEKSPLCISNVDRGLSACKIYSCGCWYSGFNAIAYCKAANTSTHSFSIHHVKLHICPTFFSANSVT